MSFFPTPDLQSQARFLQDTAIDILDINTPYEHEVQFHQVNMSTLSTIPGSLVMKPRLFRAQESDLPFVEVSFIANPTQGAENVSNPLVQGLITRVSPGDLGTAELDPEQFDSQVSIVGVFLRKPVWTPAYFKSGGIRIIGDTFGITSPERSHQAIAQRRASKAPAPNKRVDLSEAISPNEVYSRAIEELRSKPSPDNIEA